MRVITTTICFSLLFLAERASAEALSYPENKPLFTIEVPDGWEVHPAVDGSLTVQTPDAAVVAVFDKNLKGVKDATTAKIAVKKQIAATVETTGFTDLREIEGVQQMQLSPQLKGFAAKYHAKFPGGEPCIYIVAIFTPNGSNYCSAEISIKVRALHGELEQQWQSLLGSIEPADNSLD